MRNIPTSQRVIEIKNRRRVRLVRFSVLFFILFLAIFLGLGYFSHNEKVTIGEIKVEGTSIIDQEDVVSVTEELLEGRYLYFYNRANSFIFPEKNIYNKLLEVFPRIEELSVSREGLNVLNIKIKERLGAYLYCGEVIPEIESEIGENCYFVNNDGYIFDEAPYFSGNVYFRYYAKIDDQMNPLGQYVFPS
ncbi:MAG: FtsQ-type POTRA domain-containing protein, partial [Candidatus Pacebacteria bacterium]|nr:FtsQ-type POTRA domain-containing protein [Candidatus Paceibacterota bacterium]